MSKFSGFFVWEKQKNHGATRSTYYLILVVNPAEQATWLILFTSDGFIPDYSRLVVVVYCKIADTTIFRITGCREVATSDENK